MTAVFRNELLSSMRNRVTIHEKEVREEVPVVQDIKMKEKTAESMV